MLKSFQSRSSRQITKDTAKIVKAEDWRMDDAAPIHERN